MAKAGKLSPEQIAEAITLYEAGENCTCLSRRYGVSSQSINYHLMKDGVYVRGRQSAIWEEKRDIMIADYDANIPLDEMASRYGISPWSISRRLKRWGVKLRSTERTKIISRNNVTEAEVAAKYKEFEHVGETAAYFNTSDVTIAKILKKQKTVGWREEFREFMEANKEYILERYRDDFGLTTIARELNINSTSLGLSMRRWGIHLAYPRVKQIQERLEQNKDTILDAHFNKKISMGQIAETYEISHSRLGIQFKKWGRQPIRTSENTSIERAIEKMLKALGAIYVKQFKIERRRYDFYLPSVNTLIEANGDYWHGNPLLYTEFDTIQSTNRSRDIIKTQLAKDNGYRLATFWEWEINGHPDRIQEQLRQLTLDISLSIA